MFGSILCREKCPRGGVVQGKFSGEFLRENVEVGVRGSPCRITSLYV